MEKLEGGQIDLKQSEQTALESQEQGIGRNSVSREISDGSELNSTLWQRIVRHRSILFVLGGSFCSAFQSILVRYVHEHIHAIEISFIRFFLQLSIPISVMTYKNISPKPESKKAFILLLLRGVFGMIALTCSFSSFYYMRVGDATAIIFGSPVFVGIFARIIMKETFGVIDVILVFIAISGVFLISQPPFLFEGGMVEKNTTYPTQYIGAIFAFCTCVCVSFTTVVMRRMGTLGVNTFKIVLYYASIACIGTSLLTTLFDVWTLPPCGFVRFALVAMGSFNCVAQCLITYSLSVERSVFVSILRTNEVLFAFILEYLLFHEFPNFLTLLGVFFVMAASIVASLKKMWMSKKQNRPVRDNYELSSSNSLPDSTGTVGKV